MFHCFVARHHNPLLAHIHYEGVIVYANSRNFRRKVVRTRRQRRDGRAAAECDKGNVAAAGIHRRKRAVAYRQGTVRRQGRKIARKAEKGIPASGLARAVHVPRTQDRGHGRRGAVLPRHERGGRHSARPARTVRRAVHRLGRACERAVHG